MLRRPELKCKKPRTGKAFARELAKKGAQELIARQKVKKRRLALSREAKVWLEFREDE